MLGRAESLASKNGVVESIGDGIGMGLGFTLGLTLIGIFRELMEMELYLISNIMPDSYEPATIFVLAPGAFFVLAMLTAIQNKLKLPSATNHSSNTVIACGGNCSGCTGGDCIANRGIIDAEKAAAKAKPIRKKED